MQLSESDIISIARSGEGYNAEFKIRVPSKVKELAYEICAFANAAGGTLLLGVNQAMSLAGLPEPVFKTEGMFTIVFDRISKKINRNILKETREKTVEKTREKTREKVINEMRGNPSITILELAELTGVSAKGIECT